MTRPSGGGGRSTATRPSGSTGGTRTAGTTGANRGTAGTGANRTTTNRTASNTNINRNTNRSRDVNRDVNRDVDVHGDHGYYGGGGWHGGYPVARAAAGVAAVGFTAAAIGSMAYALPSGCGTVYTYGHPYYNCGGTYYQPQYQGDDVTYVVVEAPEGGQTTTTPAG